MKNEALFNSSVEQLIASAKVNRAKYLSEQAATVGPKVRWGGLTAILALGLTSFAGQISKAPSTSDSHHGTFSRYY